MGSLNYKWHLFSFMAGFILPRGYSGCDVFILSPVRVPYLEVQSIALREMKNNF